MKTLNDSVLNELFEKSQRVSDEKQKVRVLEQIALSVRQGNDPKLTAQIYTKLFKTGNGIEDIRRTLLGLGLLRRLYDQQPEAVNLKEMFNFYVKILTYSLGYIRINYPQILGLLSEAEHLSQIIGNSPKVNLYLKSVTMWNIGEISNARRFVRQWHEQHYVKGDFPCLPCMNRTIIWHRLFYDCKDLEELIREAKAHNRLYDVCEDYYFDVKVNYELMLLLVKTGQQKVTETIYEQMKDSVLYKAAAISESAGCLRILALTEPSKKSMDDAVRIIENTANRLLKAQNSYRVFSFYQAASLYFHKHCKDAKKELKMHFPKGFLIKQENGIYKQKEMEKWFRQEALRWAGRIDKRNQNNYFSRYMIEKDFG